MGGCIQVLVYVLYEEIVADTYIRACLYLQFLLSYAWRVNNVIDWRFMAWSLRLSFGNLG